MTERPLVDLDAKEFNDDPRDKDRPYYSIDLDLSPETCARVDREAHIAAEGLMHLRVRKPGFIERAIDYIANYFSKRFSRSPKQK